MLFLLSAVLAFAAGDISGKVTLQSRSNHQNLITFKLTRPGETIPFQTVDVNTASDGSYMLTGITPGVYNISAKASNFLRRSNALVEVTDGQAISNIDFSLLGGDADNNNVVSLMDLALLRAAYGTKPGDPKWDARADFNGNGQIDLMDLAILRANYGKSGIEPKIAITFPQNNTYTSSSITTVSGTIDYNDSVVAVNGVTAAVANKTFTAEGVSLSQGQNKINAIATNAVGNKSGVYLNVNYDATPPEGTLTINNGAVYANSTAVTLNLSATDNLSGVSQMQFTNDGYNWSSPEAYSVSKTWELTPGDGSKVVYGQFKDLAGNWSTYVYDTIILDTALPVSPQGFLISAGDTAIDLSWNANTEADLAGYNIYRSQTSGSGYNKLNTSLITNLTYEDTGLDNGVTYYYVVSAVDLAGNESAYSTELSAVPEIFPSEAEPNDTLAEANSIQLKSSTRGTIKPAGDQDYFKISVTQPVKLFVTLTDVPSNLDALVCLYDSNNNMVTWGYGGTWGGDAVLTAEISSTGDYYLLVYDNYSDGSSISKYSLNVDFRKVWFSSYGDSPDPFSPNGDTIYEITTFSASISSESNWNISIKDSAGVEVRNAGGTAAAISWAWDGKDGSGNALADGQYSYALNATNAVGDAAAEVTGTVYLDTKIEEASISNITSGQKLTGTVDVTGIANDARFVYYDSSWSRAPFYYSGLYYGEGTNPTSWTLVSYLFSPVTADAEGNPGALGTWDTTALINGSYVLKLVVYDTACNQKAVEVPVELYNVNFYSVSDSPDPFSPNSDTHYETTTINASITAVSNWSISIKDSAGVAVRSASGTGVAISWVWDGKDGQGNALADGQYTYALNATESVTGDAAAEVTGTIELDTKIETASISNITSGQKLSGKVDVTGIASDARFAYYDSSWSRAPFYYSGLYYGEGTNPSSWTQISYLFSPVTADAEGNPGALGTWDTAMLTNGSYVLKLVVYDTACNQKAVEVPVELYNVTIYNATDSPDPFSPNGDGKKDANLISASLTGPVAWEINIKDSGGTLVKNFSSTSSSVYQSWDGKNSDVQTCPDGTYTYTIDAVDPNTTISAAQMSGTIVLDNTVPVAEISNPGINELITGQYEIKGRVDDLHFVPYTGAGGLSYLSYGAGAAPASWSYLTTIYSTSPEQGTLFTWDTSGLESGVYSLRMIITDEAENTTTVTVPVNICKLGTFYDTVDPFSPNSDGMKDSTSIIAGVSQTADWSIDIKSSSDVTVRSFTGTGKLISAVWDGTDGSATVLPDGVYTYSFNAVNPANGEIILSGSSTLTIDTVPPAVDITSPAQDQTIGGITEIKGTVDDLHHDAANSYIAYGAGASPSSWTMLLDQIANPVLPNEAVIFNWNTANLVNGLYTLRVVAADTAGNVSERSIQVNTYNTKILSYSVAPDPFSPDGDGIKDSTTFTAAFSMALDWSISIKNNSGSEVKAFSGNGDAISQEWDGTDSSGVDIVTDGSYTYSILVTNPGDPAKTDQVSGSVVVDQDFPVVAINSPSENQTVFGMVSITGTASDKNIATYKVEYGKGTEPASWAYIYSTGYSVTDGVLANWNTVGIENGVYTIRLTAEDIVGHSASVSVPVAVDNIAISDVSITPGSFIPSNNELVTISYSVDRNCDITIKLYDLDNTLVKTLITSASRPEGRNSETWDGTNESGVTVAIGGYTITIDANDGKGWYQSSGGYSNNIHTVSGFSVTPNFNPYNNEVCEIKFTFSENSLLSLGVGQHENFSSYQWLFSQKIIPAGPRTFYWDGRDSQGKILDYYTQDFPLVVTYTSYSLPENTIVVSSQIEGQIDLLLKPYAIVPSFGEFAAITYTIPYDGNVSVSILEPSGSVIKKLVDNEAKAAGTYSLTWDGIGSSGKLVSNPADYIVKVELSTAEKTITRSGNITVDFMERKKTNPF